LKVVTTLEKIGIFNLNFHHENITTNILQLNLLWHKVNWAAGNANTTGSDRSGSWT
jgi:hypothetical protein